MFYSTSLLPEIISRLFEGLFDLPLFVLLMDFVGHITHDPLLQEFVDGVILNFSIWSGSTPEEFENIIDYLLKVFKEKSSPNLFKHVPFMKLIPRFCLIFFSNSNMDYEALFFLRRPSSSFQKIDNRCTFDTHESP
jgi:hypothetical protein